MPQVIPPAGSDGLPSLSLRAFQLADQGLGAFDAVWTAFNEYLQAFLRYVGAAFAVDIGEIGQ